MVTLEKAKEGLAMYADKEIVSKIPGVKKWIVALSIPSIILAIEEMICNNKSILVKAGYITEDNMVDIDKVHLELKTIASRTGTVTEHFPIIGDVIFSDHDVDALRAYLQ